MVLFTFASKLNIMKRLLFTALAAFFVFSATLFAQNADTLKKISVEKVYKRMLHKNPNNVVANIGLAQLCFEKSDYNAATDYSRIALDAGADTIAEVWLLYSKSLDGAGRTEMAIKQCKKALQHFPEHAYLWAEYGFLNFKFRDYEAAITANEKSLTIQPLNSDACLVYSLSLYERSNHPQAALPILFALLIDNRKAIMPRNSWLFMQMAKQKHTSIPIPYYAKRLAMIEPMQITPFMYPEKPFAISLESFDEADFRLTADVYIQNIKEDSNSQVLNKMLQTISNLKKEGHQNTALNVILRYNENKTVTDWLKIHSEDIRKYALWLDKNLPQATPNANH